MVFRALPHAIPDVTFIFLRVEGGDRDVEHLEAANGREVNAGGAPREGRDFVHATFLASENLIGLTAGVVGRS
jgi:hypothetical protein